MGKKSKKKTKREGQQHAASTKSRAVTEIPSTSGTLHYSPALSLSSASASSTCLHGAPPNWLTFPYIVALWKHHPFARILVIAKSIVDEMPKDDSGFPQSHAMQLLFKALAAFGTVFLKKSFASAGTDEMTCLLELFWAERTAVVMSAVDALVCLRRTPATTPKVLRKLNAEINNFDSKKSLVAYFENRIPCNCLEVVANAVQDDKTGKCSRCRKVFNDSVDLKDCSRCHRSKYCSSRCQREDWTRHKIFCKKQHIKRHDDGDVVELELMCHAIDMS